MKMNFKEYYESKEQLKRAGIENIRTNIKYSMTKYCKIPIFEDINSDKTYISLKPNDVIEILWEYESSTPILKKFVLCADGEHTLIPCWTSNKMYEWTTVNCQPIKPRQDRL